MKHKLAIVLPAYKPEFLRDTLQSIADQDDIRFKLYIGDDNSPFDLKHIVSEFTDRIDLVYYRFENNLGSQDLVAHWKRCVDLIQDEEWIWLFSDDDIMDVSCVRTFYKYIEKDKNCDIVRFNASIIDQHGWVLKKPTIFPATLNVADFFLQKITYQLSSFAIECIFKRSVYEKKGGFINFDLGWCSDDASWMNFGQETSIKTIPGAIVKWRKSNLNITTWDDKPILFRKVNAQIDFVQWVVRFFDAHDIKDNSSTFQKLRWILDLPFCSTALTFKEKVKIGKEALQAIEITFLTIWVWLYLSYCELKCCLKRIKMNQQ
ncbi:glycosyltransferase family 2 protein [Parapedobacter koreensis]|uniref:Glycosyltransferase involved in cell wall bisynthesis n=1 Tax=Parapedobacter koreensis TaxID=332977 RepID=A0A1H7RGQ2_9SPHI|nr:glycosyltransferase [Parapedobacter koreensis]SEL59289.1 Glycosyltransferase involved in cell wall bisynthesis [Parapedobacter koreensis]